jgi:hypothetical protein
VKEYSKAKRRKEIMKRNGERNERRKRRRKAANEGKEVKGNVVKWRREIEEEIRGSK